ncbi:basic helix-loop-helix transcription factor [Lithospermum erythrorhizon]|uniref:Basic helix-loop-helix transcription factor n=1 Tax=Lithospermum erythrorhizon TaxID=34254 RepID=A0AAV3QIJ2_LITER
MEESLYRFQNPDHRSPNINWIGAQLCVGQPNSIPGYMKPYYYEVSPNGPSPMFPSTGASQVRTSQPDGTANQFYSLPPFRQAFGQEKKPPTGTIGKNGHEILTLGTGQKRFLVFDQSGDQTTLLYSSRIGSPVPPLNSWNQEVSAKCNWLKDGPISKGNSVSPLEPFLADGLDEHQNAGVENDMHEDTEELNALLYSDDDYSEDDEETSTGHSPSPMTACREHCLFDSKGNEEVDSCAGTTKRKKLLDGGYTTPSSIMKAELVDTASSLKCASHPDLKDDAESNCDNGDDQISKRFDSLSGKKRSRKENIRDTVRILQKMIPGGQGKYTMDIIDEAIDYLKSLKAKAKDLGLCTLDQDSSDQ